jgi:hypothetical protein
MVGDNPFRAGPGEHPPALVGRENQLNVIASALAASRMPGDVPAIYTGRVLSGRTALLAAIRHMTMAASWPTFSVSLVPGADLGVALAAAFEAHTGVAMPRPEMKRVLRGLVQLLEDNETRGVVLVIDDADFAPIEQLSDFVSLVGQAIVNDLPVIAVVAGLPNLPGRIRAHAGDDIGFSEHHLGGLSADEIRAAVTGPAEAVGITFTNDGIAALVRRCRGVPAYVQMLAHHAVEAATTTSIDDLVVAGAALDAEHGAALTYYRPVHESLAPAQRRFLRALRQSGDGATFNAVRRHLGEFSRLDTGQSPARAACDELIDLGVIYADSTEQLHFSIAAYGAFVDTAE